jgi:hypothetical protein
MPRSLAIFVLHTAAIESCMSGFWQGRGKYKKPHQEIIANDLEKKETTL